MDKEAVLKIEGLGKLYGDFRVFENISLEVDKGDVVSIIGASGSGKTTLLRCVNLLEDFQEGCIHLDNQLIGYVGEGKNRKRLPEKEIAKQRAMTGMVFQSFNLFPHMTVLDNVSLGLVKTLGKKKTEAHEIAHKWLKKVNLPDKMNSYPSQISGGQQQRVAIARAIAMNPKIMLFDEATSALDPELVNEVLLTIKELAKEGTTMLIVTHEMKFAYEVSNKVIFMDKGKADAVGTSEEIFIKKPTPRLKEFLSSFNY